jgi:hypothetical protein
LTERPAMNEQPVVGQRLETDADGVRRDLGRLVLTIVELLRQLMERQALRRVEAGSLTDDQTEELGLALMHLEKAMTELRQHFGLEPGDLNLDLGPLGPLLSPVDPPGVRRWDRPVTSGRAEQAGSRRT